VTDSETLAFFIKLGGGVHESASAGCSSTLQFSFQNLPGNVTFTSDSGVFLAASNAEVSEPGSHIVRVLALGGLGAALQACGERRPL